MRNLSYLQFLLLFILFQIQIKTTIGLDWPTNSSNVKLLGLFPRQEIGSKNDMWTIHCRSMFRAAIILSQQYKITFQGEYLSYEEIITDDEIMITIDNTCQKVLTSNLVGFVGPAYSSEARYLASFAHQLGILSVSYSATSRDLSTIDNGAFYRIVPSDENTALSITILFQQKRWKSCIIIYQNDEYGYNGMDLLKEKLQDMDIKTYNLIKFDINKQTFDIDLKTTLVDSLSRIIIVWANEKSTITIINQALEDDLLGSDFVWILTTTISLNHFNQKQKEKLLGIVTIEPIKADFVDAPINTTLLNQAYDIWKSYEPQTFPGNTNVSSYALYTFDATWSLILTLQKLCSIQSLCLQFNNASNCYKHQFINSKQYYNIMRTMTFLGVSGQVKFSNLTTDREGDAYYILKNIKPSNDQLNNIDYVPVLKWNIDSTKWTYYKNQSDEILWPSLSKQIPLDHKLIRGQTLRIAIIDSPPNIILKNPRTIYNGMTTDYKQIDMTEFDGFYKDILIYLQEKMGFIPIIMLAKPTVQLNQLVEGVSNDLFDTVMTSISINSKRTQLVDFSLSLIPSSLRIIIRRTRDSFQLDVLFFLRPFSWQLWLFLLATIPFASILIWYFERQHHNPDDTKMDDKKISKITNSISYVICILLGRSPFYEVKTPSARSITYGLYFVQIILITLYTARMLAFLVKQDSDLIISGIDDIKNGKILPNRIGIVVGSHIEEFYLNSISQGQKDYYPLKTINEIYTSLINNDIDVGIWSNVSTSYHINNIYCSLMTVGVEFGQSLYQIPIKKDWIYKEDLDSNILSLIETGELARISTKWFTKQTCKNTNSIDTQTKTITIEAVAGVFIVFTIVCFIAVLLHFWPKIRGFIRK